MSVILPPGQHLPSDTALVTGCNASRCITIGSPGNPVEIVEPAPIAGEEQDSGGTVFNSPTFNEPQVATGWTGRFPAGATINVEYLSAGTASQVGFAGSAGPLRFGFNIKRSTTDTVVPGSVRFTLNGRTYVDRQGDIVYDVDPQTNAGIVGGTINYTGGWVVVEDWAQGDGSTDGEIDVTGLGLLRTVSPTNKLFFRTPGAPIAQNSLTIQATSYDDGTLIQGTADVNGDFNGPIIHGQVNVETGVAEVFFGQWVTAAGNEAEWWFNPDSVTDAGEIFKPTRILPSSAFFSAVVLTSIPLDPGILGLDPILLPSTGRVPVFAPGDSLMLVQRKVTQDPDPTAGATVDLGLTNLKFVRVRDANGAEVVSDRYTINGPAGELTWANPLDLAAYTAPYDIEALSYVKRLCTDVQVNGTIGLASGVPFDMLNADAQVFLCSKLIFQPDGGNQDLQALALNLFTQEAWTGEWSDGQIGGGTTGQYDEINFPILMTNNGSITERWRLEFVSTDTVNVIGETFGQVLTAAPITADIAPINPATSTPYFTLQFEGFSGGWDVGNIVRFNTLGANDPVWIIRSTQPGDTPELTTDRFIAHLQGDISQE